MIHRSRAGWGMEAALRCALAALVCCFTGSALPANSDDSAASSLAGQTSGAGNPYPAKLENINYRGWHATRLTNGMVSLVVVPDIGGRAIQLQLGDRELFFVNPALAGKVLTEAENNPSTGLWNYGGDKLWPGPEGWQSDEQWSSIPYYVLDGSRYRADVVANTPEEVALRVTSPEDPRTGIQFARTYHVYAGTTRVRVDQLMRNVSRRQIRWGMWHLVQHDAADVNDPSKPNPELYMYVPLSPHSMYPNGYTKLYGDVRHPSDDVIDNGKILRVHYLYRVGKVGIDSDGGWYAVVNGQKKTCFVETFQYFPGQEYPDHSSVESWNDGPGTIHRDPFDQILKDDPKETPFFLESEGMSPYITLDPGQEHVFTIEWAVTDAMSPIADSRWVGVVSEPFSAVPAAKSVALKGAFGVYRPGSLQVTFFDGHGAVLQQKKLQDVDPRTAVRLDQVTDLPAGTYRLSLCVRDAAGENLGFLGNVVLR
ncbi:MAG: DUF4380 domain-containing protein [Candidatus Acidiferrales bacterium]